MREIVYISSAKLNRFDEPARWKFPRFSGEVDLSLLGVSLKLKTDPGLAKGDRSLSSLLKKADAVVDDLQVSDAPPVWYEEADQAGQWIQFEAKLHYAVLPGTTTFVAWETSREKPSPWLLLHGSAEHLTTATSFSDHHRSFPSSTFAHFISQMRLATIESEPIEPDLMMRIGDYLAHNVDKADLGMFTGYARTTTAIQMNLIVASPLFIERINSLDIN